MTGEGNPTFSASAAATATTSEADRGVGGKIKRQFTRSHSATPYSRPPLQNDVRRRPWISRIIDPAYRIISGGASIIRPFFFSTANEQDQHQDMMQIDPQATETIITPSLNRPVPASVEEKGTSSTQTLPEGNFNISAQTRGTTDLNDGVAISEVTSLMEGKAYSQDEIGRLIDIVTTRASDLPDVKRGERKVETTSREGAPENLNFFDKIKHSVGGKDAKREFCATPIPFPKSKISEGAKEIRDEADLSPVELAKAYMRGQVSASSSQGSGERNDKDCLDKTILGSKSFPTSPLPKPSGYWPGINLNKKSGFKTPQRQLGSVGLQNHPRTPYSRTPLPNSKEKLMQMQDSYSKHLNTLRTPSQSAQTRYSPLNLRKERESGLFRPNKISRQSATPSPYSRPFNGTSRLVNSSIIESSEVRELRNLSRPQTTTSGEPKVSKVDYPTVHPHSTRLANRILDTLERIHPTPKEKSAELQLATSERYQQSPKTLEQNSLNFNSKENPSNEVIRNIYSHYPPKPSELTTSDTQNTNLPKPPSDSAGNNKPVLPSISVANPSQKWGVPSSSNTSFTFPVSSSRETTTSEPTTPSFMPFRTSPPLSQHEIPQFGFNSNRGDKSPLVFTFPSESEEEKSIDDDARLGIKFTIGSDKRRNVSFGSVGSDSVCC